MYMKLTSEVDFIYLTPTTHPIKDVSLTATKLTWSSQPGIPTTHPIKDVPLTVYRWQYIEFLIVSIAESLPLVKSRQKRRELHASTHLTLPTWMCQSTYTTSSTMHRQRCTSDCVTVNWFTDRQSFYQKCDRRWKKCITLFISNLIQSNRYRSLWNIRLVLQQRLILVCLSIRWRFGVMVPVSSKPV